MVPMFKAHVFPYAAAIALALLSLFFLDTATAAPRGNDHIISHSPGGRIGEFASLAQDVRRSGGRVVIDGPCYSACAWMFTSQPNVCFTDRAQLAFHRLTKPDGSTDYFTGSWMAAHVRSGLKQYAQSSLGTPNLAYVPISALRSAYSDRRC
jgi:hypothetical protein